MTDRLRYLDLASLRLSATEYRRMAFEKGADSPGAPGYAERTLAENLIAIIDAIPPRLLKIAQRDALVAMREDSK